MAPSDFTPIECSECGGHFRPGGEWFAMCEDCGSEVSHRDIAPNMEEGEVLTFVDGVMGYYIIEPADEYDYPEQETGWTGR